MSLGLNNRMLKVIGGTLTVIGILFTGFLAHEARYFTRAEAQDMKKGITKQTAEIKLLVLENRRIDLEQRIYELQSLQAKRPLTDVDTERLLSFTRELAHLTDRIKRLQAQVDATE